MTEAEARAAAKIMLTNTMGSILFIFIPYIVND